MSGVSNKKVGKVFLVGAGPGDAGLITVRGLEVLCRADIVVYDALANPVLLREAPAHAELIDVGKRAKEHKLSQDQINQLLVDKAVAPLSHRRKDQSDEPPTVVRLKGGDPYLFGRGAEEAAYLARRDVECEVVPGVTAGVAVPAYAGVPITHRQLASTVSFVTGHEDPTKSDSSVDYAALAQLIRAGGTACFYMGVGRLSAICQSLQQHGLDNDWPVAVIQWGTRSKQRSLRSTLTNAAADVQAAQLGAPAIIVVGKVAAIDEPGLDFFQRRPLLGQTILVTRSRQQASDLSRKLIELGAEVIEAPTIELVEPTDWTHVDPTLKRIHDFDWLVLTSVNGVAALAQRLAALDLDARHLAGVKLATIGDATAHALQQQLGVRADLIPTRFVAESLAGEMIAKHGVKGKRCLLLRADIARPALPKLLTEAGAEVIDLAVYETKTAEALPNEACDALQNGDIDWVTFTSSSTVRGFAALLKGKCIPTPNFKIASIGPITSQTVSEIGWEVAIEASQSTIGGLTDALLSTVKQDQLDRAMIT